jgi:hypothetical protein
VVTKAQIIQAIQALPDDVTADDVQDEIERLKFVERIDSRLAALDAGAPTITQDEMERRVAEWFK